MKKTEKLNIGGFSFNVEEDAVEVLSRYLESVHKMYEDDPAANEICSDIEERIGELLAEKCGSDRVVSTDTVEYARMVMGDFGEGVKPDTAIRKRLYRDSDNKFLAGVFSGIAAYTDTDVVIYRIVFVALLAAGLFLDKDWSSSVAGLTALAYIICWICIPEARSVEQKCQLYGKPISVGGFRDGASRSRGGAAPAVHMAARVLLVCLGVYLVLSGCLNMICTFCFDEILKSVPFPGELMGRPFAMEMIFTGGAVWSLFAASAFLSIWKMYAGILLIVNRKAPSWRPGLILFLLFLASSIVAGIFLCRAALAIPHIFF